VVHRGRRFFLTDPAGRIYSAAPSVPGAMKSVFCNSFGHSVPVINGRQQQTGRKFRGTMRVEGLGGARREDGPESNSKGYGLPELSRLERVISTTRQRQAGAGDRRVRIH